MIIMRLKMNLAEERVSVTMLFIENIFRKALRII